jgi:hypothetical protein
MPASSSATSTAFQEAVSRAKPAIQTSAASGASVLRDRNDLEFLAGCADDIPDSLAHQKPRHWRYE